jgi:alpha-2-macroglobulin
MAAVPIELELSRRVSMEHPMKRLIFLLGLTVLLSGQTDDEQPFFSLSSSLTFATGEKPSVELAAVDVADLDFRVYRINDPLKFFRQLPDAHSFGGQAMRPERQQTLLEKFHHLKAAWHSQMRFAIRDQFDSDAWTQIRSRRPHTNSNERESNVTSYAAAPVLNSQQLVATWKQHVKSLGRWRSQSIPVEVKDKGVYVVEAVQGDLRAYTLVFISDLALITKASGSRVLAFAADRKSGQPIAGADLSALTSSVRTDENGLVDITVPSTNQAGSQVLIMAKNGSDFAVSNLWFNRSDRENYTGYTYTDRPVYRPGHEMHFKTILRSREGNSYQLPKLADVNVEVQGPDDKTIYRKTVPLSAVGSASGDVSIPKDAGLGYYSVVIKSGDFTTQAGFEVQEYKKPEYDVRVTPTKGRILQGEQTTTTIDARYFFGEPVANAKVHYVVHRSRYWYPLWGADDDHEEDGNPGEEFDGGFVDTDQLSDEDGTLDANGRLTVSIPTKFDPEKKWDSRYRIEARVTDAGNREISGSASVIATYGSFLINAEPEQYVVAPGSSASFKLLSIDYDGKPVSTKIVVDLLSGYETRKEKLVSSTSAETGLDGHGRVSIIIPSGGSWKLRIRAHTPENREVEAAAYLWASGGEANYSSRQNSIQIIPDRKTYQPGDTARLLIVTGVSNAKVLVGREGRSLTDVRLIDSKGTSFTIDLPVSGQNVPDFFVSAAFLRDGKLYQGVKQIKVPPKDRELAITVSSDKPQYTPGETAQFAIEAKDSSGKPVAGEFSVGIVDEAVYGVRRDGTPDIVKTFYGYGYNTIQTSNSLNYYFHGEAGKRRMMLADLSTSRHALAQLKPDRMVQPKVRKEFPDTALWLPAVKTGTDGHATTSFSFPDSVTTWRTTTRGITADTKVGSAIRKTIVRKNIILRLVTPRFFTQNDEATLSTVVHNYLSTDKPARISLDAKGLELLGSATPREITIPSRGEVKVDWRVRASSLGNAVITGKALTDEESDAVEWTIPVEPQGVKITRSRSGIQNGAFNIAFPAQVVPSTRQLEITISPSIAGALFSAVDYLTQFPYGCTEQTLSGFVPNIVVSKALSDLKIKSDVNHQALTVKIRAGLDRLYDFQHEDGGWGWWKTDDSGIFMTTAVVAGFSQARAAGIEIKPDSLQNALKWLKAAYAKEPRMLPDLKAYSVYALALAGDTSLIEDAWKQRSGMSAYGQALLGLSLESAKDARAAEMASALESSVKSNDSEAWWPNDRDTLMNFYADTSSETTAFAMKLLVHQKPQSTLLPKAAVYLMNHRREGFYWYSTKQTAMVIYGLTDYLKATGELKPNLRATVAVNGKQVAVKAFQPSDALSIEDTKITVPGTDSNNIKIESSGEGRLYWSVKQIYYSTDQKSLKLGNASLNILRDYFRLTPGKNGDRIVYGLDPLQGPLSVGDVLAVRITVTGSEWKYLMMEDPIPAGTEFVERDDLYELKARPDWWITYFSRREFHDDRAAIFQSYFDASQKQYFYLLKVVNPGAFRVSPASVQPMYQPDLLSTTENKTVEVK